MLESFSSFAAYLTIFLTSLISSSTIFLPLPVYVVAIISSSIYLGLNPLLIILLSALGNSLGELTAYFFAFGSKELVEKKIRKRRKLQKYLVIFSKNLEKYGEFAIVLSAALPFPYDFIGLLCGFAKYDIRKFLLFTFIGKTIKMFYIVISIYLGIEGIRRIGEYV